MPHIYDLNPRLRPQEDTSPKRARSADGKLKADDPTTPDVNEAWEGGKAPKKKRGRPPKKKE
jgi:hypothetical protein